MDFQLAMEDSKLFTMSNGSPEFGARPQSFQQPFPFEPLSHAHHHDSQSCRGNLCTAGLERQILCHTDVSAQFEAVSLCLRLPIVLLKSLHALRSDTQYHDELKTVYGQLFTSPSPDLFNLIHMLRIFPNYDPTKFIDRLKVRRTSPVIGRPHEAGRTAPDGFKYICPSENCRKDFSKSGHAQNHLKRHHPEYLQLHPDYEPQQSLQPLDGSRSQSTSPELHKPRKHDSRAGRHGPPRSQGLAMTLGDDFPRLTPSPRGPSPLAEIDEQLTRSPSNGRPSPRQPATPQSTDTNFADRHSLTQFWVPASTKRNRDSDSSYEKLDFSHDVEPVRSRHERRSSKRFSMSSEAYWQA